MQIFARGLAAPGPQALKSGLSGALPQSQPSKKHKKHSVFWSAIKTLNMFLTSRVRMNGSFGRGLPGRRERAQRRNRPIRGLGQPHGVPMPTPNGRYRSLLTHWPTYTTGSDMGDMGVQKGIRLGASSHLVPVCLSCVYTGDPTRPPRSDLDRGPVLGTKQDYFSKQSGPHTGTLNL